MDIERSLRFHLMFGTFVDEFLTYGERGKYVSYPKRFQGFLSGQMVKTSYKVRMDVAQNARVNAKKHGKPIMALWISVVLTVANLFSFTVAERGFTDRVIALVRSNLLQSANNRRATNCCCIHFC
jgi:hypothetical protein